MANGGQDHHSFEGVAIRTARGHAVVWAMSDDSVEYEAGGSGVVVSSSSSSSSS